MECSLADVSYIIDCKMYKYFPILFVYIYDWQFTLELVVYYAGYKASFPNFYAFGCLREEYVSLSNCLSLPEGFTDTTAWFVYWQVLASLFYLVFRWEVHEHSGVQPIQILSLSPTTMLTTHSETGNSGIPAYSASTAFNRLRLLPISFLRIRLYTFHP